MGNLIDVGRYMGAIRRRARMVVLMEELQALEREEAREETRERLRRLQDLVRGM